MADWVRHDEMHQAFNFPYLNAGFSAPSLRAVVDDSLQRLRRRWRPQHLGALQPRRGPPRYPLR